jgi:hypothetical protein
MCIERSYLGTPVTIELETVIPMNWDQNRGRSTQYQKVSKCVVICPSGHSEITAVVFIHLLREWMLQDSMYVYVKGH